MDDSAKPSAPQLPADSTDRARHVVVPHRPSMLQWMAGHTLALALRTVAVTLRTRMEDHSGFFEHPPVGQGIYCVWHNRLALCLHMYFSYPAPRSSSCGLAAMVSASRDGAFLSTVLRAHKVEPVRGSTSRRGRQALLELARWARRGYDLAITPDGPRGPRYRVQPGIISLAQVTGLPILPFSYSLQPKIQVKSWDRFQIPLPFARFVMKAAPPIRVPREATETDRERSRRELEEVLVSISVD
jgi:lysophospholipid acyltransferase (LPLAT)-like uncharacterized protein